MKQPQVNRQIPNPNDGPFVPRSVSMRRGTWAALDMEAKRRNLPSTSYALRLAALKFLGVKTTVKR